jgi:Ca-activated chloride channel homolog
LLQHNFSPFLGRALAVTVLVLYGLLGPSHSAAQSPLDQVHVLPHVGANFPRPAIEIMDFVASKPIKVNVNLVLVPVTVTDPMDRIVTNLDREDFEIIDGKASQD